MRLFYAYIIFSRAFFLGGIWIIFLLQKGISLVDVAILEVVFWILLTVGSIPGGILADHFGRKRTLILAMFITSSAIIIFGFARSIFDVVISYVMWAIGGALSIAAEQAWIYDEMKIDAHAKRVSPQMHFQRFYGRLQGAGILSLSLSTMIGGYVAQLTSMEVAILMTAVSMLISTMFLLFIKEKDVYTFTNQEETSSNASFSWIQKLQTASSVLKQPLFLLFALVYVIFFASLFAIGFFVQPWLESLELDLGLIGLIQGLSSLVMSVGYVTSSKFSMIFRDMGIGLLVAISVFLILGMGALTSVFAVVFFLVLGVVRGLFTPLADSIVNEFIPSEVRATVISMVQAGQTALLLTIELVLATLIERWSFQLAFLLLGSFLAFTGLSLSIAWVILRSFQGRRAHKNSHFLA